ncbi:phage tail assembly protein [Sodalis endosymbiont of Spalangia cameroni]|uniref:phage tail assembly protein n=1 Tax=Sodalis praecaptivus TaxID=1239307 RepID=UPI0031F905C1
MSKKNHKAITLATPIIRGSDTITAVTITDDIKQAGSLRGLRLVNVLNLDTDAITTLLERVTSPRLKKKELNEMDTRDFVSLSEALIPFLTPPGHGESSEAETENP